jgi:hypothetical protein
MKLARVTPTIMNGNLRCLFNRWKKEMELGDQDKHVSVNIS